MFRCLAPMVCVVTTLSMAPALAQPADPAPAGQSPQEAIVAPQPDPAPIAAEELGAISAADGTITRVLTHQQLSATASGNTVDAGVYSSGQISFSPEALAGFSGIGNFVINTGANNALQGAINVSIVTAPVP